ncbi:hypothetical protein ACMFMG_010626 [Clarireedia jacksonii]
MDIDKEQTGDQSEEELNESSDESSSESQSDSGHKSYSKGQKNTLSDDEADIWSPGMKIKSENNSDVTVEFYKAMGRNSFRLLTQRGPPNASSYRMEREMQIVASLQNTAQILFKPGMVIVRTQIEHGYSRRNMQELFKE